MDDVMPATENSRRGWLGPLPVWAWVLITLALVIGLLLLGIGLFSGNEPAPSATSPTPTATSIATPTSTPTQTPDASGDGTFDSTMDGYLASVLDSQNTAVLAEGGTFSDPVFVLAANSGLVQNMTPTDAVEAMTFMFIPGDPNPWDFALPDSTLTGYRAGPYGEYFPEGAIVARSSDGHVFSFIGSGLTITTMFMAASEDLLQ